MPDVPEETTDVEQSEIRALLAASRVTGPIPPDVAARLEAELAQLHRAEPTPVEAPVLALRHRLRPVLLVAASVALVAGGVAIGINQFRTTDHPVAAESAGSTKNPTSPPRLQLHRPQLHRATFAADAAKAAAAATDPSYARAPVQTQRKDRAARQQGAPLTCPGPRPTDPDTITVPALLDRSRAALVFLPRASTGQRVEAWSCDGTRLLAQAVLPAR